MFTYMCVYVFKCMHVCVCVVFQDVVSHLTFVLGIKRAHSGETESILNDLAISQLLIII